MEIRVISTEIIKPSSLTPEHLRSYKLSPMDHYSSDFYFPFVYFYSEASKNTTENTDHLKKSLSKTLTYYYPFAGRVKDDFSVCCDDYGATFIEAKVAGDMSELIKKEDVVLLEQLRPYDAEEMSNAQVNLAVQVNYFDCGGVAVCVSFRHAIADACAAAYFVKNWATVACGGNDIKDVIFDSTSIFPSQDVSGISKTNHQAMRDISKETITKWLVFDNTKIAALQEKIGGRSTRYEALLALMMGAMIDAKEELDESNLTQFGAIIPVNLRKKMNPPLPEKCIGNAITLGMTYWTTKEKGDYNKIVSKAREVISMVDDYAKADIKNGWMNCIRNEAARDKKCTSTRLFTFTSICRLPFYETDFGWGKPVWFSISERMNVNTFVPVDTCDGKGIEVMVGLSKEDMANLEQHPAILAYANNIKV
ncbi:hypothetical protein JRO89_XS08G0037600 [Xanthoceras sorbifolium]|uniref:Uncharacterized protein n=1 Tax=Xanthoceras sorbifolium TaxID=99658 RepID=A0ABQ8HNH9_9ROSI|nr:hypothetical protein JRO89_XS08G0037600 [Xanthoceras sorbifolium]